LNRNTSAFKIMGCNKYMYVPFNKLCIIPFFLPIYNTSTSTATPISLFSSKGFP